jgi:hypothetical protein
LNIANGLFNWGAWPYGANDALNVVDASYYLDFAKGMPYMMPVCIDTHHYRSSINRLPRTHSPATSVNRLD